VVIWRATAVLIVLAACKHAPAVPVDPRELDAALDCAVRAADGAYAVAGYHIASPIAQSLSDGARPSVELVVLRRMGAVLHEADDLVAIAFWLAKLGDAADARTINEHALALAKESQARDGYAPAAEALVVAWTGDPVRAESLVAGDMMGLLLVAEGAARAGNRPAAEHAYAEAMKLTPSRDSPTAGSGAVRRRGSLDSPPVHGQRAEALVWLGRVAEARAIASAEPKPEWRAYILELMINAALETHASELDALFRETGSLVDTLSTELPASAAEMSGLEDRLALVTALDAHRDHDAAAALRAKVAAVLPKTDGATLSTLALLAEIGNRRDEADELVAKAGSAVPVKDKVFVTIHRGVLAQAIGDLAVFDDAGLRPQLLIALWAQLAANPDSDGALVARFKAEACRAAKH
jgi:hypothetical protein